MTFLICLHQHSSWRPHPTYCRLLGWQARRKPWFNSFLLSVSMNETDKTRIPQSYQSWLAGCGEPVTIDWPGPGIWDNCQCPFLPLLWDMGLLNHWQYTHLMKLDPLGPLDWMWTQECIPRTPLADSHFPLWNSSGLFFENTKAETHTHRPAMLEDSSGAQ